MAWWLQGKGRFKSHVQIKEEGGVPAKSGKAASSLGLAGSASKKAAVENGTEGGGSGQSEDLTVQIELSDFQVNDQKLNGVPRSAFLRYASHVRPRLLVERPELSYFEIAQLICEKWGTCDAKEREQFESEEKREQQEVLKAQEMRLKRSEAAIKGRRARPEEEEVKVAPRVMEVITVCSAEDGTVTKMEVPPEWDSMRTKWGKRRRIQGPKRPNSAYIFFCNAQRPAIASKHPELKHIELQAKLGALWQTADPEMRKPFVGMAMADKARYKKEMVFYERFMYQQRLKQSENLLGGDDDDEEEEEGDADED